MDIKKTWAFFVLYLIDLALSQSILDLLGSSGKDKKRQTKQNKQKIMVFDGYFHLYNKNIIR